MPDRSIWAIERVGEVTFKVLVRIFSFIAGIIFYGSLTFDIDQKLITITEYLKVIPFINGRFIGTESVCMNQPLRKNIRPDR